VGSISLLAQEKKDMPMKEGTPMKEGIPLRVRGCKE
jgi:hypothetical protein